MALNPIVFTEKVILESLNREFEPLVFKENSDELKIIAALIDVLGDSVA